MKSYAFRKNGPYLCSEAEDSQTENKNGKVTAIGSVLNGQ